MKTNLKQVSIISSLLVAFSFLPCSSLLANEAEEETKVAYPQNYSQMYMKTCLSDANDQNAGQFLEAEDIKELCSCTFEHFTSNYTYSEYEALPREEKEKVGNSCFQKILFQ